MSNYFQKTNYFKRNDKNLDLRPFVKNWEFTMHRDDAMICCKEKKSCEIGQFIAKYVLSLQYGSGIVHVPDGVCLSGNVFKHNEFRNGVDINTSFIRSIQVLERDKKGTLYRATTEGGHNYYFRSEDSSEAFDKIVDEFVLPLDLFVDKITDPRLNIMPLVVLSEED